jgi:hypothetical protein
MSKSCWILIFLAGPGKHRVTRNEPRPIRSPALRLAVSRVAAVDSERQSLIQEAITTGDGRKTANQGNIDRCLKSEDLWSNAAHRRYAPSWPSGCPVPWIFAYRLCSASFEDTHQFNLRTRRAEGRGSGELEGNIHMIDDPILRVPNVERKCAMACLVSDAQDRPLECLGCYEPSQAVRRSGRTFSGQNIIGQIMFSNDNVTRGIILCLR